MPVAEKASITLLIHKTLVIRAKRGVDKASKEEMLGKWYREQVKTEVIPLITKWEELLGVKVEGLFVQQMKTRWGSCNTDARTIRLNSELAKKPREFLEYVLVHEMVHLIERGHGEKFVATMDRVLPRWRFYRDELNRLPV